MPLGSATAVTDNGNAYIKYCLCVYFMYSTMPGPISWDTRKFTVYIFLDKLNMIRGHKVLRSMLHVALTQITVSLALELMEA